MGPRTSLFKNFGYDVITHALIIEPSYGTVDMILAGVDGHGCLLSCFLQRGYLFSRYDSRGLRIIGGVAFLFFFFFFGTVHAFARQSGTAGVSGFGLTTGKFSRLGDQGLRWWRRAFRCNGYDFSHVPGQPTLGAICTALGLRLGDGAKKRDECKEIPRYESISATLQLCAIRRVLLIKSNAVRARLCCWLGKCCSAFWMEMRLRCVKRSASCRSISG
ncbi:hypothetical protein P154DRAFT_357871 [Amniculicola lignicola CBS 123094]|uniref:Uncharacterized protein n=1 Tax=Amniculicola lignicola CBS 123094 TaxID=1392246 RepID=A0A6A5WUF2_9PLEO|nr:hypothetical protein P154DRAFT_357871 [Amniculicola lignicola CBS 123094]